MRIKEIEFDFTVCKVEDYSLVILDLEYVFIGKTDEEKSLGCITDETPSEREDGWKALRIEGILDFSLIGILSKICGVLAENKIGVFDVSSFNTDYILIKKEQFDNAIKILENSDYEIIK